LYVYICTQPNGCRREEVALGNGMSLMAMLKVL
jgi:hypothetical protein